MTASLRLHQELLSEDPLLTARIIQILNRPSASPVSFKEIIQELTEAYDAHALGRCLFTLTEQGRAKAVFTSGYELGFKTTRRME